jgi:PPOX class probable F420-dependent enzyme
MAPEHVSWSEVADRLRTARSYWLATIDADGSPHVAPLWGATVGDVLYLYSERRTVKARNLERDPRAVLHLEDAENVVVVHGVLADLGRPDDHPDVLSALAAKYHQPADARYLPTQDPDFDVLWALRPTRALLWCLSDFDGSQARWHV